MAQTTFSNGRGIAHKGSGGKSIVFPDVCLTPMPPGPPVPIPYPNIAKSSDASKTSSTVKVDGKAIMLKDSEFSTSTGDEAGSQGGVMSGCTKGKAQFIAYSFDVKVEGQNVPRNLDMMKQNGSGSFNAVG